MMRNVGRGDPTALGLDLDFPCRPPCHRSPSRYLRNHNLNLNRTHHHHLHQLSCVFSLPTRQPDPALHCDRIVIMVRQRAPSAASNNSSNLGGGQEQVGSPFQPSPAVNMSLMLSCRSWIVCTTIWLRSSFSVLVAAESMFAWHFLCAHSGTSRRPRSCRVPPFNSIRRERDTRAHHLLAQVMSAASLRKRRMYGIVHQSHPHFAHPNKT